MESFTRSGAMCECYKADQYGRQVCNVRLSDGSNAATHMQLPAWAASIPAWKAKRQWATAKQRTKHCKRRKLTGVGCGANRARFALTTIGGYDVPSDDDFRKICSASFLSC